MNNNCYYCKENEVKGFICGKNGCKPLSSDKISSDLRKAIDDLFAEDDFNVPSNCPICGRKLD